VVISDGFAKVHLRRCASSFVTAYFYVRLIPQDPRALHLEFFTVPPNPSAFYSGGDQ
jgi:hypothetical protein